MFTPLNLDQEALVGQPASAVRPPPVEGIVELRRSKRLMRSAAGGGRFANDSSSANPRDSESDGNSGDDGDSESGDDRDSDLVRLS